MPCQWSKMAKTPGRWTLPRDERLRLPLTSALSMAALHLPPVDTHARALAHNHRPRGLSHSHNGWGFQGQRPRRTWYWRNFQRLGHIQVEAYQNATNRLNVREDTGSHIFWDPHQHFLVDSPNMVGLNGSRLNTHQLYFLESFVPPGVLPRTDVPTYKHILRNIVASRQNKFVMDSIKDLYFFLIHIQMVPNLIRRVRHIHVKNITDGPYVAQAIAQLKKCRRLRTLTLGPCVRCREIRAGVKSGKWRAWKSLHQSTFVAAPPPVFQCHIYTRPNFTRHLCAICRQKGATGPNRVGEPVGAVQTQLFNRRMIALQTSMLR